MAPIGCIEETEFGGFYTGVMDLGEHHKDLELVDNIHKMAVDDVGTTCMKQLKTDDRCEVL